MTQTKQPYHPSAELLVRATALGKPLTDTHRKAKKQSAYEIKLAAWKSGKLFRYFWPRVDQTGGEDACWPWKGSTQYGYGRVIIYRQNLYSHRVAAMFAGLLNGPFDPHQLRLSCENKLCCNPKHMTIVDPQVLPYAAPQPVINMVEKPVTTRKPRGPNKRKGLPMGWVAPGAQAYIEKNKAEHAAKRDNPNSTETAEPETVVVKYDPFKP